LPVAAVVRMHRSRRSQWTLAVGRAVVIVLALLAVDCRLTRAREYQTYCIDVKSTRFKRRPR